jgi:hypothetical protein
VEERRKQLDLDLGLNLTPTSAASPRLDLSIKQTGQTPLGPAQIEFNKRLKSLEKARTAHQNKRKRLDKYLATSRDVLMPLVDDFHRAEYALLTTAFEHARKLKLSRRRRALLDDFFLYKAEDLMGDPSGLSEEEIEAVGRIIDTIAPPPANPEAAEKQIREEFEELRGMLEAVAKQAGADLDLSGLDPNGDPEEFEREFEKRLEQADPGLRDAALGQSPASKTTRKRKPTKAARDRERRKQEVEEAKKRNFKTLYKQLAKVLHPDLETDPELKAQKHAWMQRLTTAQAAGDLREMLAIEMEWLGEESGDLEHASEEKLKVFAMVLKEQASELRERTRSLVFEPEYGPLQRFIGPFSERFAPKEIQAELHQEIEHVETMLEILKRGGTAARTMILEWIDPPESASFF